MIYRYPQSQILNTDLDVLDFELVVPLHDESFVVDLSDKYQCFKISKVYIKTIIPLKKMGLLFDLF